MTGTDVARFTHKSVSVIFEPPCIRIRLYKTVIFPVVFYECETWSLTLREELMFFTNRVLRRIFGHERDEVRGEWRKVHNAKFNDLYSLLNIIRVIE